MANAMMNTAKVRMLNGGMGLPTEGLGAILVNVLAPGTTHAFSQSDEFRVDITAGAVVDTQTMTGVTVSAAGLVGCDDFSFVNTTGSDPVSEAIYFFTDVGTAATDELLVYHDTATGLPVTPNGNNIDVDCTNGILQL